MKTQCTICPKGCGLDDGQTGFCGARINDGGKITCDNYGKTATIALDRIEKKPLRLFHPGKYVLSTGSYGCNLRCPFCQNHRISMPEAEPDVFDVPPERLVEKALSLVSAGNIGIAYTYNEPLVGYEYVMDCAKLAREKELKNVLVTNGYINEKPLAELLPYIDAMNIDLKSFRNEFYEGIGGSLAPVLAAIEAAAKITHVEVTALIIPGENDAPEDMDALSLWLSGINKEIPLHITRFFPRYKYSAGTQTPTETIDSLVAVAKKHLLNVFAGNF